MIFGQSYGIALLAAHFEHGHVASFEEARRCGTMHLPIDNNRKLLAHQVDHLLCALARHYPGVGGDAGVGCLDFFDIGKVVVAVDLVDK